MTPADLPRVDTQPADLPMHPTRRLSSGTRRAWLVAASRPFGAALFRTGFQVTVVEAERVPRHGAVLLKPTAVRWASFPKAPGGGDSRAGS